MSARPIPSSSELAPGVVAVPEVVERSRGASIHAEDLGLRTRRGWVFRHASFEVPGGTLASIAGPAHSGRSALLLSVAGRMRPTEGSVTIDGIDVTSDRDRARQAVGVGLFEGLNDLERDLTVADHVRQELTLHPEIGRDVDTSSLLREVGLAVDPGTLVEDLTPLEGTLLGVALALVGSPAAIVVDDADRDLGSAERAILWHTLGHIAGGGTTVLATCIDHEAAVAAGRVLDLGSSTSKEE